MRAKVTVPFRSLRKCQWIAILCGPFALCAVLVLILSQNQADAVHKPGETTAAPALAERDQLLPDEPEILEETYPTVLSNGQPFGLRGIIVCKYPMTEIRATVTNRVTGEMIFDVCVQPNAKSYAIGNPTNETINDSLVFDSPECSNSWLNYRVDVSFIREEQLNHTTVLNRDFKVGNPLKDPPKE